MTSQPQHEHPFWDGCARGVVRVQLCDDCGGYSLLARAACPACLSETMRWVDSPGRGTIESVTRVHRPPSRELPSGYGLAVVRLDEGPSVLARADPDELWIGQRTTIGFSDETTGGRRLPVALPA